MKDLKASLLENGRNKNESNNAGSWKVKFLMRVKS
jgi:hypothetical protein